MPSPFKRHGASRQIQPMSALELRDSLLASEQAEAADIAERQEYPIRNRFRVEQGESGKYRVAINQQPFNQSRPFSSHPYFLDRHKNERGEWVSDILEFDTEQEALNFILPTPGEVQER